MRDAPYEELGKSLEEILTEAEKQKSPKERFFTRVIEQTIDNMQEFLSDSTLCLTGVTIESLRKRLWGCIDFSLLPDNLSATAAQSPNQLMEQQSQQQSQQERMALVHKELLSDPETKTPRRTASLGFSLQPKNLFAFFLSFDESRRCKK